MLHRPAIIPHRHPVHVLLPESSRQSVDACGCCFARPDVVVVVDVHRPDLQLREVLRARRGGERRQQREGDDERGVASATAPDGVA